MTGDDYRATKRRLSQLGIDFNERIDRERAKEPPFLQAILANPSFFNYRYFSNYRELIARLGKFHVPREACSEMRHDVFNVRLFNTALRKSLALFSKWKYFTLRDEYKNTWCFSRSTSRS